MRAALLVLAGGLAGALACWGQARAGNQGDAVRVITHTRQYCEELSTRAASMRQTDGPRLLAATVEEARMLAAEGDRLCAHGQIRPGIIRLRRAIMLLRAPEPREAAGR